MMMTYREFVKEMFKKRPKTTHASAYMKEVAVMWRKKKGGKTVMKGKGFNYADWEKSYIDNNEDQIVEYINEYGKATDLVGLPAPVQTAIRAIRMFPRGSIKAKRAVDELLKYSPQSIFKSLF